MKQELHTLYSNWKTVHRPYCFAFLVSLGGCLSRQENLIPFDTQEGGLVLGRVREGQQHFSYCNRRQPALLERGVVVGYAVVPVWMRNRCCVWWAGTAQRTITDISLVIGRDYRRVVTRIVFTQSQFS